MKQMESETVLFLGKTCANLIQIQWWEAGSIAKNRHQPFPRRAFAVYKSMSQGPVDTEGTQLFPVITLGTAVVGLISIANTLCEGGHCTRGLPFTIADDCI